MRRGFLAGAVLLLSLATVQAFGQTWVTNTGFASNRLLWDQFNYPVVSTPMLSLNSVSLSPAGASNATPGNVAGATNATLSITNMGLSSTANMTPPAVTLVSVSGQPTVVGAVSALVGPRPFVPLAAGLGRHTMARPRPHGMMMAHNAPQTIFLNTGAAVFDNAYGIPVTPENLAQAAKDIRAWEQAHPPAKVYTNQDVDRIHQQDASRPETAIPAPKQ
ncbi:MAG TPA: hypothetical protein VGR48_19835 [Terriglobales bacterium]|nr:hypothetical protein [Terriglobales bacterium]